MSGSSSMAIEFGHLSSAPDEENMHVYEAHCPKETDPLIPSKECHQPVGPIGWINNLADEVGYKLLVMLFFVQHILKGFVTSFSGAAVPYLYKSYSVAGPQVQIYSSVAKLPWAVKPVIGLISDVYPIFGYNKAPYVLLSTLGGLIGMSCIGLLPHDSLMPSGIATCLFFASLQLSSCDLLSEAKYAEKMKQKPAVGPTLLSYVWFGVNVAGLFATLLSGVVVERSGPKVPFVVSILPCAAVLLPVCMGFFEEKKQTSDDIARVRQKFWEQGETSLLCMLMLTGTAVLSFCGLVFQSVRINAIAAVVVGAIVLVSYSLVLSPIIAKVNAFALIQTSLAFSIGGATFYFYTDTPEQFPEGPHFSPFFYNSVMGAMAVVFSLFGIWAYNSYMKGWKYRELLMIANVVYCVVSMLDVVFFLRLNKRIGLSDHVFVLGAAVIESTVMQWMWMPQVVMLAYLCPTGMEATMYALPAGCHNLGNSIASNLGALMLEMLSVVPTGAKNESKQFEKLWVASLIASVLPTLTILLLFKLIPDARQDENLVGDAEYDATSGSLLRQWMARSS